MKGNTKNIQNYFKTNTKRISFKVKFCSSRLRTVVMQRRERTKYNRKQKRFSSDLKVGWRRGWGLARNRCRRGATRWWWATRRWRTAAAPRSSPSSPRCSRLSGGAAEWTKSSTLSDTLWSERDLILCHTESVVSCLPCHIHISLINNLRKYTLILLRPLSSSDGSTAILCSAVVASPRSREWSILLVRKKTSCDPSSRPASLLVPALSPEK